MWAIGPFLAACSLLAWSGARKIAHPDAARVTLRALRLPSTGAAARGLGVVEIVVAAAGALFGGLFALAVAGLFVGFAIVAARLITRAPGTPCGCLGSNATASWSHVVVNLLAATAALVVAVAGGSPLAWIAHTPAAGVPLVVLVGCAAWLAALTIDALPALTQPYQEGSRR